MDRGALEAFKHVQSAIAALDPEGEPLALAYLHQAHEVLGRLLGIDMDAGHLSGATTWQ